MNNRLDRLSLPCRTSWLWYVMLVLYLLYFSSSQLFNSPIVGQAIILVILLISGIGLIRILKYRFPQAFILFIIFLILLTFTFAISPRTVFPYGAEPIATFNQYKTHVGYFMPVFLGYYIGRRQRLPAGQWVMITILMLLMALSSYIRHQINFYTFHDADEFTNNAGYDFILCLLFVPLFMRSHKILALTVIGVVFVFVMLAAKRGAILCFGAMAVMIIFWFYRGTRISAGYILMLITLIVGLIVGTEYLFNASDYLQERLDQTLDGNSSYRDTLYSQLWTAWTQSDFLPMTIGHGTAQTVNIAGNYAHNDWLEVLINNGLIGALVYLGIFISLFRFRKKFTVNSPERASFSIAITLWFLTTIFSMGMSIEAGIRMMLIGTLIGNADAIRYKLTLTQQQIQLQYH